MMTLRVSRKQSFLKISDLRVFGKQAFDVFLRWVEHKKKSYQFTYRHMYIPVSLPLCDIDEHGYQIQEKGFLYVAEISNDFYGKIYGFGYVHPGHKNPFVEFLPEEYVQDIGITYLERFFAYYTALYSALYFAVRKTTLFDASDDLFFMEIFSMLGLRNFCAYVSQSTDQLQKVFDPLFAQYSDVLEAWLPEVLR